MLGKHTGIISFSIISSFALFVFSEIIFFSGFFASIGYNLYSGEMGFEISSNIDLLDPLGLPLLNTFLLVSSGVVATWKHEVFKVIDINRGIEFALVLGGIFILVQYIEFSGCNLEMSGSLYGCSFFRLTGFHGFHVVVGLSLLLMILSRFYGNQLGVKGVRVDTGMVYWHLVDVIWIVVVIVVYGGPFVLL